MKSASYQVCDELLTLMERMKHVVVSLSEAHNVTKVQFFVLMAIKRHGGLSMGQVADMLYCDASNVTGLVDRLVAQNLVVRQESQRDRRTKILRLTTQGQRAVESLYEALPHQLGCDKLTAEELQVLRKIIHKVCG